MTLPSGANLIFVIAFLALTAVLVCANWSKRSRL